MNPSTLAKPPRNRSEVYSKLSCRVHIHGILTAEPSQLFLLSFVNRLFELTRLAVGSDLDLYRSKVHFAKIADEQLSFKQWLDSGEQLDRFSRFECTDAPSSCTEHASRLTSGQESVIEVRHNAF